MKYIATLNFYFDCYVESALYNADVFVIDGNDDDKTITIETELPVDDIMKRCSVDIDSLKEV